MPGTTVPFNLPYPLPGDPLNVAGKTGVKGDFQKLAEAVDALTVAELAAATAAKNPPAFVIRGGTQSIPSGAQTFLTFNTVVFDNGNFTNLTTNPLQAVLVVNSIYMLEGTVGFAPNATGQRNSRLALNAAGTVRGEWLQQSGSDPGTGITVTSSTLYQAAGFANVQLQVMQNSGANLDVLFCELAGYRVAP